MKFVVAILADMHMARKRLLVLIACFVVIFFFSGYRDADQGVSAEYKVKAVFLYNFLQFVNWPDSAFSDNTMPFIVGVLGDDPFGALLDEALQGESINHRALLVKRYDNIQEASESHMLFIGESEKGRMRQILKELKNKNLLTVSDTKGFGQMGGMIELARKDNQITIKINQESLKTAKLQVSSKLLSLAEIVSTENADRL